MTKEDIQYIVEPLTQAEKYNCFALHINLMDAQSEVLRRANSYLNSDFKVCVFG